MSSLRDYQPLSLNIEDEKDLSFLSASMQDAVAKIGDFAFVAPKRRFAFVANRFVWECAQNRSIGPFARVRAGVHFDDVLSVQQSHLRLDAKDAVVELLAVRFEPSDDGAGAVLLEFSGGGAIRLDVEAINAGMTDLSEPWRTRSRPTHEQ